MSHKFLPAYALYPAQFHCAALEASAEIVPKFTHFKIRLPNMPSMLCNLCQLRQEDPLCLVGNDRPIPHYRLPVTHPNLIILLIQRQSNNLTILPKELSLSVLTLLLTIYSSRT